MCQKSTELPQLFISYSHKDEEYLDEFVGHLSPLERNGKINIWYDKKLIAGENLDEVLATKLQSADLVVFLVSANFIQSVSCYEKELVKTIDRGRRERVEVIPVILKECLWKNTVIGKFVASTKNGKSVMSYSRRDEAWVEIVQQIEKKATEFLNSKCRSVEKESVNLVQSKPEIKLSFSNWLNGTEIVFQHKIKENILLPDVFVYPDLVSITTNYDNPDSLEKTANSLSLIEVDNIIGDLLIHGDEQSGKTSLIKMLYREYYKQDFLPLIANAKDISTADPKKALSAMVKEQYKNLDWETFVSLDRFRVLFVDDLHHLKLNIKYQQKFLISAKESFSLIVLVADSSLTFDEKRIAELAPYR